MSGTFEQAQVISSNAAFYPATGTTVSGHQERTEQYHTKTASSSISSDEVTPNASTNLGANLSANYGATTSANYGTTTSANFVGGAYQVPYSYQVGLPGNVICTTATNSYATAATGPRRKGKYRKEVIQVAEQAQPCVRQVRHRLPTPEPDVLEKVYIRRAAADIIEEITEVPSTPPPVVRERTVVEPSGPPKVVRKTIRVPPRGIQAAPAVQYTAPTYCPFTYSWGASFPTAYNAGASGFGSFGGGFQQQNYGFGGFQQQNYGFGGFPSTGGFSPCGLGGRCC